MSKIPRSILKEQIEVLKDTNKWQASEIARLRDACLQWDRQLTSERQKQAELEVQLELARTSDEETYALWVDGRQELWWENLRNASLEQEANNWYEIANEQAAQRQTAVDALADAMLDLAEAKENYEGACVTVAAMHAAAVGPDEDGSPRGPILGVVEDVGLLREGMEQWRTIAEHWYTKAQELAAAVTKPQDKITLTPVQSHLKPGSFFTPQ